MTSSYKTKRCEHCGPNDITCDWCGGTHWIAYSAEEESKKASLFLVAVIVGLVMAALWVARP